MVIISDTGPLIALAKTHNLIILKKLFERVIITPSVFHELRIFSSKPGASELREAFEIQKWIEASEPIEVPPILGVLDPGEAESIVLAKKRNLVLLIDERKGRKIAKKENVKITGTGAVLLAAKQKGIIKKVSPIIDQFTEIGYRISNGLKEKILRLAQE